MSFISNVKFNPITYFKPKEQVKQSESNQNAYGYAFDDIQKSSKVENILWGTLLSLATLGTASLMVVDNIKQDKFEEVVYYGADENKYENVYCDAEALAKGGEDDSRLEVTEFMNLLNFDHMKHLPESTQDAIKVVAMASIKSVDINSKDAKIKILDQINKTQNIIDKLVDNKNAEIFKEHNEPEIKYENKYVTPREILNSIDFTPISNLKSGEQTLILAKVINSIPRIERNHYDTGENFSKAVEQAQNIINKAQKEAELKAFIAGNDDKNNVLSRKELFKLLNCDNLDKLPQTVKEKIIKKIMINSYPLTFDNIGELSKEEIRKKVTETIQVAQDMLDTEVNEYISATNC